MGNKMKEDGMLEEFTSFTTLLDKEYKEELTDLLKDWPTVKSTFKEHGLSCSLNMAEGFMEVSTTTKTRDANVIYRARDVLELLSINIPFSQAKEILENKMERIIFDFGNARSAFCRRYTKKRFLRRWGSFNHYWKSFFKAHIGRQTLYEGLGCFMFVPAEFKVVVYGPPQGIKEVRRIVLNCMENKSCALTQLVDIEESALGQEQVMEKLVHQFGVSSIMEAVSFMKKTPYFCEQMNTNFAQALLKMQETIMLETIADKCSSLDSPEVRANAADTLLAIVKFAPPELASRISMRSLTGRLLRHALEDSQPKAVIANLLSICISLLDPKEKLVRDSVFFCEHNTRGSTVAANHEILLTILDNLGDLLKLLDDSAVDNMLLTTYGRLQPPLGLHRLKIVELISVLLRFGSEAAEKELICLGAVPRILDLLFEYPFNNFLHHHVEKIIETCLESKYDPLVQHILHECDIVGKILEAEKNFTLTADSNRPTVPAEARSAPRRGNIGHLTRMSNKIFELGSRNRVIQAYLQENSEWTCWLTNVLSKRKAEENVNQWLCGRPTLPQDMGGDDGQERQRKKLVVLDIDGR